MKIDSSWVNMSSGRLYTNSTAYINTTTYFQFGGSNYKRSMGSGRDTFSKTVERSTNNALPSDLYSNRLGTGLNISDVKDSIAKFHEEMIKRLEEFMEQIRNQLLGYQRLGFGSETQSIIDLTTMSQPGSLWTREVYESYSYSETETTNFSTTGVVKTADGRSIDFNVSMEMSRAFTEQVEYLSSDTQYVLTDPLVIQLEDAPETISDQKWFFDIDGDGKKEEISQLAKGNAFLALDENDNGIIDDGSELFGTKSGNGFKDLAAYDEDGNGWIDKNDSVYSKLKVWSKDASGNDRLTDLKQADIGAIYLGAVNTNFSHNSLDTNETQAVVRQTGIYLHESTGAAGTIQQIDFATAV